MDTGKQQDQIAAEIENNLPWLHRRLFTLSITGPTADLPVAQSRICTFLFMEGPRPITEIADELGMSISAATKIVDRLEKIGRAARSYGAHDKRVRVVSLTRDGHEMFASRRERRIARVRQVLGKLGEQQCREISDSISALLRATFDDEPEPSEPTG